MTRWTCLGLAVVASLGLGFSHQALAGDWPAKRAQMAHPRPGEVLVIAHRACWKETAENSLAAVRACSAMGVDGVEFDVRHTRDGVAVVMHDETVDRMTDGHGKVSDLTLAQVTALHLKQGRGGVGAPLTSETVPTLVEYLEAAKGKLWLVFDVKDGTQEESFATARVAGVQDQAIFFYECRNDYLLNKIRPFWDQVVVFPIRFEADGPLSSALSDCPSHPANLVHAKWSSPDYLAQASGDIAARQERVWIATMFPEDIAGHADADAVGDPDAVWGKAIREGANMIMTNEPAALLVYLKSPPKAR